MVDHAQLHQGLDISPEKDGDRPCRSGRERFGKGGGPPVVFVGLCSPHELTSLM